jgi:hypothetical protein
MIYNRVYESWPLYEILNQFKKGHSHMAVVLKGKMETESNEAHAVDSPIFLNIITNKESNQIHINGGKVTSYTIYPYSFISNQTTYAIFVPNYRTYSKKIKLALNISTFSNIY